ncbi:PAS domain-containing protein [Pseudomonas sp. CrR14]|nr:PAS domain-containing protein [Pseudomonas sp. CrR14]
MPKNSLSISVQLPAGSSLASKLNHELIEHLPVGVYLCDASGTVVAYNRKAAEIWGETPSVGNSQVKFCGAHKLLTLQGVHVPHEQTPLAEILVTRKAVTNFRTIVERRDGSRVPVLANIVPLFDDAGTMLGFMNSVQDLRHQIEQELAQQHLESALFQSQKMEVVGQITSGLAHDFNNQLASMSMALSLMEKEVETANSSRLSKYYALCRESVERATGLAENLLRFSRKRAKRLERVDPNQILLGMASLVRTAIGSKILLNLSLAPDARFLKANKQQLESAVLNLAINARDAMPDGGTLTISTHEAHLDRANFSHHNSNFKPGSYTVISVIDTGCGMAPEVLDKVFAPFFTTKEDGQGTGLGLSMVRGFVNEMNGQLTVESEPGQGSCFRLHFPCYGSEHSIAIDGVDQPR